MPAPKAHPSTYPRSPATQEPPAFQTAQNGLAILRNRREGSVAAVVTAALLPFAAAWHLNHEIPALTLIPELVQLPDLAATR